MELTLNFQHPKANLAQLSYIHSFLPENYMVCGRGGGKTVAAVVKAVIAATAINPGAVGYVTEQTGPDIRDILVPAWREIVPPELYVWKQSDLEAHFPNGSVVKFRARHVTNTQRDPFRGPTVGWIIHDELAADRDDRIWNLSVGMLRDKRSRVRFIDGISTPRDNWFREHLRKRGLDNDSEPSRVNERGGCYHGTTADNEYNGDLEARIRENVAPEYYEQEALGRFISLSGRAFPKADLSSTWPAGNLHPAKFERSRPYWLGVDLGETSSWVVVQRHNGVDVVVGEATPGPRNKEGASQTLNRIEQAFGRPAHVAVGHDFGTSSIADRSVSAAVVFANRGWRMPIDVVSGWRLDHVLGHMAVSGRLCTVDGSRRLCVSQDLISLDKHNSRGVMEMLRNYAWSDNAPRVGSYLPRDGLYEHTYDALRYYTMAHYPPSTNTAKQAA